MRTVIVTVEFTVGIVDCGGCAGCHFLPLNIPHAETLNVQTVAFVAQPRQRLNMVI